MKKYILEYMNVIDTFISVEMPTASLERKQEVLAEFLTKIQFFQHERLIHLIVTVLFALLEMSAVYVSMISPSLPSVALSLMFLVLLVPYIFFYEFLENEVQKMYLKRDVIVESCKGSNSSKS
ncbi:MAG: hypothetical protein MJ094_02065 [Saccharofermentans sp.]|nr:hypothetical protein [Saccharofermentans sp.]